MQLQMPILDQALFDHDELVIEQRRRKSLPPYMRIDRFDQRQHALRSQLVRHRS